MDRAALERVREEFKLIQKTQAEIQAKIDAGENEFAGRINDLI